MQSSLTQASPRSNSPAHSCHTNPGIVDETLPLVAIVGAPNVGKSVLFNALTGAYVNVSNYPGTTVEVTRGRAQLGEVSARIMDTPGMYSLLSITEEERVARQILFKERPQVVLHVVDAKNLERMLPMTLQLIQANLPVILVVNMLDEADNDGLVIDLEALKNQLGIPVVGTALAAGRGKRELRQVLAESLKEPTYLSSPILVKYPQTIERALKEVNTLLQGVYSLSKRAISLMLLQDDHEMFQIVAEQEVERADEIHKCIVNLQSQYSHPIQYVISRQERRQTQALLSGVLETRDPNSSISLRNPRTLANKLSEAMIHPLTGFPILLAVLFLFYQLVGVFGAQTLVNWLEVQVFYLRLNPWVNQVLAQYIPWLALRDLIGGEFGVITLGLRYAIAIILPLVGVFFLAFSMIEDSGYLPRIAMLIDRSFKKIGLSGRAVIPMVLGFGCDTMATIVTRTLETRRERLLATILLSLAIPCSAQLGVILALLAVYPSLLWIWLAVIIGVFILVGYLGARLMPGEQPTFYMELPPLRMPQTRNVLVKTYTRMEWYLREVFPMFILASLIIWIGRLTGLFTLAITALKPVVSLIGLPEEAAVAFLFGFFRRDYGAAGLFDLRTGMNPSQILVATVTMTLFIPCIAQLSVTAKERGWKTAVAIAAFVFPFALLVGGLLSVSLRLVGFGA